MRSFDIQAPSKRKRLDIPEELCIITGLAIVAVFIFLLVKRPDVLRPIASIPVAKGLSAIGLFLNLLGTVAVAVDLLTGDSQYLKRHANILSIFFLGLQVLPVLYFIVRAATLDAPWNLLWGTMFFLFGGASIAVLGDRFEQHTLAQY